MNAEKIKETILIFAITLLVIFGVLFGADINNVDEMWTFSFSSKLANGYMIYRDYNMVQTPLYAQITSVFLRLFGNNMFISCIVGSIICALIVAIQYLTLRKLNIDKKASTLIITLLMLFLIKIATNSYNILSLLFVYIVLYIEICKVRYDKYIKITNKEKGIKILNIKISYDLIYNILSGICIALTFLAKQTAGAYVVISITLYYFGQVFILKEKTFKKAFLELTQKAIACIVVISIELLWLYINGALYQFMDYTFLGLRNFGGKVKRNFFKTLLAINRKQDYIILILTITSVLILPIMLFLNKKGYIKAKNNLDNNILLLTIVYFIIAFGYSFPLANAYHIDMTKQIILYLAIINISSFSSLKSMFGTQMSKIAYNILIIVLVIYGGANLVISKINNGGTIEPFENMNISGWSEKEILEVRNYILDFERNNNIPVYIIDSFAVKYNLVLDRNGGIFDLPLYGNLGHKDYNLIIEKLEQMDNYAVIILENDEDIFWQEPKEVREYIQNNLKKIDSFVEINTKKEDEENKKYKYDVYIKE